MRFRKVAVILLACILLCGCAQKGVQTDNVYKIPEYTVGMWLSYSEIDRIANADFKAGFREVLQNCKTLNITDLFVHIRAFGDAIYPSEIYPLRNSVKKYDYDLLEFAVSETHRYGMRFHAWINPYRIYTGSTDINVLPEGSPVRKWLEDENTENDLNVAFYNGIYLNPASSEVRKLVIDGIREILQNYKVDGIHFDDYFYPTSESAFDSASYDMYASSCSQPLSLADWRRANVNRLISGTYVAVKFFNKDILFSVSPAASVQKNKEELYADVEVWMKEGCVDVIIPQLYFGFEYKREEFRFERLLQQWKNIERAESVRLFIGLAAYKINESTEDDGNEWQTNADVLYKQANICKNDTAVNGHVFYSYTALFSSGEINKQARELLKERK